MLYILLGLIAAMWIGLAAHFFHQSEALFYLTWLDPLFWGSIVAGVVVAVIDSYYCPVLHCLISRVSRRGAPFSCPEADCGERA